MNLAPRRFRIASTDTEAIAGVIQRATQLYGHSARLRRPSDDVIHVQATQTAPWYRIILRGMLQRTDWLVTLDDSGTGAHVTYDRRWFLWYRFIVLSLAVPAGLLWCYGLKSLMGVGDDLDSISLATMLLPWMGFGAMVLYARLIVPIEDSTRYVDAVRSDLREKGFLLETCPNATWDRVVVTHGIFLTFVAFATLPVLADVDLPSVGRWSVDHVAMLLVLLLFLALFVVCLRALFVGARRFGADERFAAVATYILGMMAIISFLAGQVGVHGYGRPDTLYWKRAFQTPAVSVVEGLRTSPSAGQPQHGVSGHADDRQTKLLLLLPLIIVAGSWIMGLFYVFVCLRRAILMLSVCRRLRADPHIASNRASISGSGFLRGFREIYLALWIIFTAFLLLGTLPLITLGYASLGREPAITTLSGSSGAVRGAVNAIALLTDVSPTSRRLNLVVRLFLVSWAAVVPMLVGLSVGDHVARRRRTLARLRRGERILAEPASGSPHAALLQELTQNAQDCQFCLVITDDSRARAMAHGRLLHRSYAVVEVSRPTVELLDPNELKALVAHEMAHHVCGHGRRHELLIWLGRLTLAGDTFVGALENSFGYELEADTVAVERFQVQSKDLRNALLKMQVAALLGPTDLSSPQEPQNSQERQTDTGSSTGSFRRAIAAWLALYRGEPPLSYWHPSLRERLARLEELEKNAKDGGPVGVPVDDGR